MSYRLFHKPPLTPEGVHKLTHTEETDVHACLVPAHTVAAGEVPLQQVFAAT